MDAWQFPTLAWGDPTLPLALRRFTSEFGMGQVGPPRSCRQANWFSAPLSPCRRLLPPNPHLRDRRALSETLLILSCLWRF